MSYTTPSCLLRRPVLDVEKQFMEAAKRNNVETMKTLSKGLNANAKNVVRLKQTLSQYTALFNITELDTQYNVLSKLFMTA